ncbi:MAG TPA: hypothetical protein DDY59_07280 [Lachnospiraceae bacterium]|nr:hypothetical protein [Lachnospiraceae bacterium]HCA68844.1 hypothetical protein [Lachnospiraceae bacterium]HCM11815.1 hypothetical protein [Lachnospiraceae bacterium]HCR40775.1 hypothetical protein [Lachnospiraceae bacterium]
MVTDESDSSMGGPDVICPFHSYMECVKDSGYYYLTPEVCKDIIIKAGVSGVYTPKAIRKVRRNINHLGEAMEQAIPAFHFIGREVIGYYGSELAECLVKAAGAGKGVDIVIGYPKILVFKVN